MNAPPQTLSVSRQVRIQVLVSINKGYTPKKFESYYLVAYAVEALKVSATS